MKARTTLIKNYRNKETLRLVELQEVADFIRNGAFKEQVSEFRSVFPLMTFADRNDEGTLTGYVNWPKNLPRICFALEQEHRNGERITRGYTGLVLLEVNNLASHDEADAVRKGAAEMPQTLMAFVGADGQSVKIVCQGELFPGGSRLPESDAEIALFHENLYERARLIYNGQLGVTVEKLEPTTQRICYMSSDPGLVYNPMATPIYAKAEKATESITHQRSALEQTESYERYKSMHTVYEFSLSKAYDDTEGIADKDERRHAILSRLAQYCMETGLAMAPAMRQTLMKSMFWDEEDLVKKVFENAYREELVERHMEKKGIQRTKTIPPETLLTMKINIFLNSNYELRKNVMRGVAEYRTRTGIGFSFQDLTEEARNSITMRALEQGIRCWDKDIRRYVNSDDIERYDPVNDYLDHLPRWDGKDRVTPLAERVPTEWKEWTHLFHIWMRSMVAMWLGKGQLTGNALVPLLIGRQGCGKSSFCRILLPRELQDYYNDRINFKNENDLNLGLSSFGLINLDEFDRVTQRQQIVLKYLVSTADLKYRPPYGKAYTTNRRYASFIGTTNEQTPLTDPSGSRRFLCVFIDGDIDFETPVQHDQLFAQLMDEIRQGERYWLSKEEERALMEHNLQYQRLNGLGEMLMAVVQKPRVAASDVQSEEGQWMSLKDLSALLKSKFKGYKEDTGSFQKIGSYLNRPEYKFQSHHTKAGTMYWVKVRV
ncbi:Virulence-associated protein E [Prevotella sp. ne3005]|uniref:VapE domain-containing protein n=1 Tax=Prevotella sp. ne3005 TaxID=1761887 RepID=UPI0008D03965|nr:VapE domain-containing protein [Prevotella sp. ne3005]SEM76829.1 Virulence-associated protein E [Prevotella sp. ne3005]